jgi:hypothetical protein
VLTDFFVLILPDVDPHKPCDVCGGMLAQPVTRDSLEAYVCQTCGQDCVRGDRLLAHSAKHTKVKAFFCDHCPRNFSRASRLEDHKVCGCAWVSA